MKKKLALLLALVLLSLCACGESAGPDPNAGLYEAVSASAMGLTIPVADVFEDGFSLELKNGGKATFHYEGKDYSMKWTLDGTAFHAEGGGAALDGTLADGEMVLQDVLDSGIDITLICEALAEAVKAPLPAEAGMPEKGAQADPELAAEPGQNAEDPAVQTEAGSPETDISALIGQWQHESGYTYRFEEDGTGAYTLGDEAMAFTYERKGDTLSILFEGSTVPMELPFSIDGETLTVIDHFGKEVPYQFYVEEPVLRALETLPVFDAGDSMAMSNWSNLGYFLIEDDVFYGDYFTDYADDFQIVRFEIVHDGTDLKAERWTLLDGDHYALFLQKRGDLLYYVERALYDDEDLNIVCMKTDGSSRRVLVEGPCYFLCLMGDRMFFTDAEDRLCSADLNGGDLQLILDRAVYYSYPLNEDWMVFQDDADRESLHLYYIPKQIDLKLNDEQSYDPMLVGSRLFYNIYDGTAYHLSCIDLSDWEAVRDPGLKCQVPVFTAENSELSMGVSYSFDGTYLLPANNYNGKEPQDWMNLEDDAYLGEERYYVYHSAEYEVEFKLNGDYLTAIMFRDRSSIYSNAIPWLN